MTAPRARMRLPAGLVAPEPRENPSRPLARRLALPACEPDRRNRRSRTPGARVPVAAGVVLAQQHRRRDRDRGRPAAGRLADPRPFLVSLAALLQWLPPLLFGLHAGALADRLDRRLIVVTVDLLRACAGPAGRRPSSPAPCRSRWCWSRCSCSAPPRSSPTTPRARCCRCWCTRDDLALANSRLQVGFITVNQLAGPPIGAALFAAGMAWPFVTQAVLVALGAVLVSAWCSRRTGATRTRHPPAARHRRGVPLGAAPRRRTHPGADDLHLQHHLRRGLVGARPLRHPAAGHGRGRVRPAHDRLGGGRTGGHGGVRLDHPPGQPRRHHADRAGHRDVHAPRPGPDHQAGVALAIFFVFGAHAFVWGTTSVTVRQRAVPTELQGRVGASTSSACSAASSSAPASAA